jgi:hypothetical protein
MGRIDASTSPEELAATVSQTLEHAGITATLSGGGAVVFYSRNEYESYDLDFVTGATNAAIASALAPLGFQHVSGSREFRHPETDYYVEFPPGPLAFGETVLSDDEAVTLETAFGPLRIVTPTQSVMDRMAAYVHWKDNQAFDQAIMIARRQPLDWTALREWASRENVDDALIRKLRRLAEKA